MLSFCPFLTLLLPAYPNVWKLTTLWCSVGQKPGSSIVPKEAEFWVIWMLLTLVWKRNVTVFSPLTMAETIQYWVPSNFNIKDTQCSTTQIRLSNRFVPRSNQPLNSQITEGRMPQPSKQWKHEVLVNGGEVMIWNQVWLFPRSLCHQGRSQQWSPPVKHVYILVLLLTKEISTKKKCKYAGSEVRDFL